MNESTSSNVPIKRDADVFNLANIFEKPQGTYYEYEAETKAGLDSLKPNFMIQGGSFAEGFYNYDYADFTKNSYLFFYNRHFCKKDKFLIKITKWEDIDFTEILDNVDFVVVELNEAVIPNFSNGFVEYLDSFLDRYIAKQPLQDVNNGF